MRAVRTIKGAATTAVAQRSAAAERERGRDRHPLSSRDGAGRKSGRFTSGHRLFPFQLTLTHKSP
jgi:hypothetical protein